VTVVVSPFFSLVVLLAVLDEGGVADRLWGMRASEVDSVTRYELHHLVMTDDLGNVLGVIAIALVTLLCLRCIRRFGAASAVDVTCVSAAASPLSEACSSSTAV
jgi:hypothetical protein